MKSPHSRLAILCAAAGATLGFSALPAQEAARDRSPVVIPTPSIPTGSNASRAPFLSARPFNDVRAPDGHAVDPGVPPNTPATDPEPLPLPPARVAIFQRATPSPLADPGLLPTGRPTVSIASSLDAPRVAPTIRASAMSAREEVLVDVESRIATTDTALRAMRNSTHEMSAAGRAQFRTAEDEAKQAERALRKSLKAARKASAQEWESARAQLAADYEAYNAALGRLDTAAGIAPAR